MIDTQDLEKIVALSLCTAYIKGDKPLSLLIVSDRPGGGKTEVVKQFSGTPRVEFVTDISGHGLKRDFATKILKGEVKHIIIPEMLAPLSKGKTASDTFTAILQAIIEDGVMGIHTGFTRASWSADLPFRSVGVICCLPRLDYLKVRQQWVMRGFLSRFLVVSYRHSDGTIAKILKSIEDGDYLKPQAGKRLNFDGDDIEITISSEVSQACGKLGMAIVAEAVKAGLDYGYREVKHIRSLVAANVIYEHITHGAKRTMATVADFEEIQRLGYLFNEQFNSLKGGE